MSRGPVPQASRRPSAQVRPPQSSTLNLHRSHSTGLGPQGPAGPRMGRSLVFRLMTLKRFSRQPQAARHPQLPRLPQAGGVNSCRAALHPTPPRHPGRFWKRRQVAPAGILFQIQLLLGGGADRAHRFICLPLLGVEGEIPHFYRFQGISKGAMGWGSWLPGGGPSVGRCRRCLGYGVFPLHGTKGSNPRAASSGCLASRKLTKTRGGGGGGTCGRSCVT